MKRLIILTLAFLLIISCTKKPSTDTILKLGDDYYTLVDFFDDVNRENFVDLDNDSKKREIKNWALDKMFYREAKKLYSDDKEVQKKIDATKENLLINTYLNKTILDSIINDEYLHNMYDKYKTEVKLSHIFIKFSAKKNDEYPDKNSALELAKKISKKAQNGASFEELVKKYSDDKSTLPDGDLGWNSIGRFRPNFENKMYSLKPGEISDPFQYGQGFQIIKIEDKRDRTNKSFEELKNTLKRQAISENRSKLQNSYKNLLNNIKNNIDYVPNDELINAFITKFSEYKKVSKSKKNVVDSFFQDVDIEGILVETSDKKYDIKWFKDIYKNDTNFKIGYLNNKDYLKSYLQKKILAKHLISRAKKYDVHNDQSVIDRLEQYKHRLYVRKLNREKVIGDINLTEKQKKQYYEKNKNDKFLEPAKAEVREIFSKDKDLMDSLKVELDKGANFDSLSQNYTERQKRKDKNGYYGFIAQNQYRSIGKTAHNMNENTVSDSILQIGSGYSLIKVYDKKDAAPKPYDEVVKKVENNLKSKLRSENREKYINNLKKKYGFKIYWKTANLN
ncbi:MAG: peptidylprolyl isomerase [Candidatus Marinimicrobia bacterium]|nr:peptidylprolyl isomerase [Candidatus Neomarinimicrobiota bacterium]